MSTPAASPVPPLEPDLSVRIGALTLRNPVMVASGTFGYGEEYADLVDLAQLGAVVVKGVRMEPWPGNATPRMVEVPGGLINAIGLQGPGAPGFVRKYMPFLRSRGATVIVNIWGRTIEEYADVARYLSDQEGIHALELNISCPNIKEGGIAFGTDEKMAAAVIAATRAATRLPLIPKLSPNVSNIGRFARVAEENGADGVSLINSFPAMVIDVERRRPVLANKVGGLSGPAVHPIAVRLVWEAAKSVRIPLIGMGGITDWSGAVEFLLAGASAVAVGTANFTDPATPVAVLAGLRDYMRRHGFARMSDVVGKLEA